MPSAPAVAAPLPPLLLPGGGGGGGGPPLPPGGCGGGGPVPAFPPGGGGGGGGGAPPGGGGLLAPPVDAGRVSGPQKSSAMSAPGIAIAPSGRSPSSGADGGDAVRAGAGGMLDAWASLLPVSWLSSPRAAMASFAFAGPHARDIDLLLPKDSLPSALCFGLPPVLSLRKERVIAGVFFLSSAFGRGGGGGGGGG